MRPARHPSHAIAAADTVALLARHRSPADVTEYYSSAHFGGRSRVKLTAKYAEEEEEEETDALP